MHMYMHVYLHFPNGGELVKRELCPEKLHNASELLTVLGLVEIA